MNLSEIIRLLVDRFGRATAVLIPLVALLGCFSVSVAGFLIQVPSEFWPFVDSYFLSSHFARFSIFIALSLLAARYSTEALSSFLTFVSILICILWCFSSGKRRRLLRVKGTAIIASDNPPRAVWSMRDKFGNVDPKNVRLSVKYATGLTFFTRYLS